MTKQAKVQKAKDILATAKPKQAAPAPKRDTEGAPAPTQSAVVRTHRSTGAWECECGNTNQRSMPECGKCEAVR